MVRPALEVADIFRVREGGRQSPIPASHHALQLIRGTNLLTTADETMGCAKRFFGWSVAWAAFALAAFAWGIGFYGPSVFLQTLHASHGWSISEISAAITFHFLLSALLIAYLPEIHSKFGIAGTTIGGALLMGIGLIGWSGAWQPWQLFVAAVPSASSWAATSGAALNAIVARWFDRDRPKAMGLAFNGASVGGALFVPLWVFLIDRLGFQIAALSVAVVAAGVVVFLSARYFNAAPASLGLAPDGDGAFGPYRNRGRDYLGPRLFERRGSRRCRRHLRWDCSRKSDCFRI